MADNALARCQKFLGYHPLAKWLSIAFSLSTGILYVGLIILLGLFIDLMVDRGRIPCFHQLSDHERVHFLHSDMALPEDVVERETRVGQIREELKTIGIDPNLVKSWAARETVENWTPRERALLWWAHVPLLLREKAGGAAADKVREDLKHLVESKSPDLAAQLPLTDAGLLSLVVRNRTGINGRFLGAVAEWNEWMWAYGNSVFLLGLFMQAIVVGLARLVLLYFAQYLGAVAVVEALTRLRRAVYHHTNRLGTLAFRALGPSEAVSISARHLEIVHDGLYQWLTVYFRETVKFGLLLAFTFLVHFWLAVAFLLFALLVWLVGGQAAAYFRRKGRVAEARAVDHLVLIQESLMLMRLIKIYLMEAFNQTRVERQLRGYAQAQLARYRGDSFYLPLFFFLGLLSTLILLLVAGYVILADKLGVSSTLVLAASIISLYWPVRALLEARRSVKRCRTSAQTVFSFLDRQGGVGQMIDSEFIPPLAEALDFSKVGLKEAGTGRRLLTDVSFTIRAGSKTALVGPDDREKHALVYLLPRFLDPSSGEIRLDGKDLRGVTLDSLRAQIAMVLQHNLVFNDTIANNIGCGDQAYNSQRIIEAAKIAHAHQFILKLPEGYGTQIGDLGHPLKLSEKYRIALARAILRDPAILVIEEPITPLDNDTKGIIDDTLQRIMPGRTVIFLPHRLSTIKACDQILLLYQGRIDASGDHRELLESSDLYRHLQYIEFNEYAGLVMPPAPDKPPAEPADDSESTRERQRIEGL